MLIEDLRLRISSELKNGDDIPPTYILFRWLKAAQVIFTLNMSHILYSSSLIYVYVYTRLLGHFAPIFFFNHKHVPKKLRGFLKIFKS